MDQNKKSEGKLTGKKKKVTLKDTKIPDTILKYVYPVSTTTMMSGSITTTSTGHTINSDPEPMIEEKSWESGWKRMVDKYKTRKDLEDQKLAELEKKYVSEWHEIMASSGYTVIGPSEKPVAKVVNNENNMKKPSKEYLDKLLQEYSILLYQQKQAEPFNVSSATITEFLNNIPVEEISKRALANLLPNRDNVKCSRLSQAIDQAFTWSETPEGGEFWAKLANIGSHTTIEILRSLKTIELESDGDY